MSEPTSKSIDAEIEMLKSLAKDLRTEIARLQSNTTQSAALQNNKVRSVEERLESLSKLNSKIKSIEDIPGVRTPRWYTVDIDFDYSDTAAKSGTIQISPDGPFICTQIQPYYLVLDTDTTHYQTSDGAPLNPLATPVALGRYIPCTAAVMLDSQLFNLAQYAATGAPGFADAGATAPKGPLRDIPEFSFQIQVAGSGTFWTQNRTVPAAAFYGYTEPLYSAIQGYVERTDRILVNAVPETSIPLKGRVRMVFHGFQILGHIKVSDMLGY